jgi:hypothetical protein
VKLSVLMPVYNDAATLAEAVKAGLRDERIVVCRHVRNRGKGAAIRTAAQAATGDAVVVRDADLEDGKKLRWRDGVEALWILTRVRLSGSQPDPAISPPSRSGHPLPPQGESRAADDLPGDGR